jgi:hypothetical protein
MEFSERRFLWLRLFGGEVPERLPSPDGQLVAEVVRLNYAGATDLPNTGVELRTKLNPFGDM